LNIVWLFKYQLTKVSLIHKHLITKLHTSIDTIKLDILKPFDLAKTRFVSMTF